MKFSIQRKSIRAMLHLAAKKDLRYYLQGVNVVRDNRGTYIEATDGHVLGRLLIDGIRSDTKLNVVLPTDALSKLKGTKKQGEEWLSFSVEGFAVECIDSQSTTRFSAHDARFPDTDRVIPMVFKDEDVKPSTFNPDLLVRFVDVSEELYGNVKFQWFCKEEINLLLSLSLKWMKHLSGLSCQPKSMHPPECLSGAIYPQ